MTAHENRAFALKLRKLPRAESEPRVHDAAAILGIEPLPATGSEIGLEVAPERVHLFDADTGARMERESLA